MSDVISDMLTNIRNAQKAKLLVTSVSYSKLKEGIASVLLKEGYIKDFIKTSQADKKIYNLEIHIKYTNLGENIIKELTRISKPGRRVYSKIDDLPKYKGGMGIYILSTSKGIICDKKARELSVGGEVLCRIF